MSDACEQCADNVINRDPLVIPGGMIPEPDVSPVLLFDVSIRPRMNFYLDGERGGSFIVDAKVILGTLVCCTQRSLIRIGFVYPWTTVQ